ncbi:Hypothetical Protein FCC1311_017242 [Hondaea fermentalgiana]|uniref:Uncharacterized protein n=1 Tax=Hondaea fermentalgiana TaxID=2315210 RepID=A0A2R5G4M1_9STRA|nr:Hypothetical Protein FCC1311_017242 [Hondaea fermentalgiana]|eukprot:GBG25505.1 Hypothetical Protein FCC1311_017242 [Hondaea fermentalgiana]
MLLSVALSRRAVGAWRGCGAEMANATWRRALSEDAEAERRRQEQQRRREAERQAAIEQEERIKAENKEMISSFSQMADWIDVKEQRLPTQFGDGSAAIDFSNAIKTRQRTAEERKRISPSQLQAAFDNAANAQETQRTLESLGISAEKAQAIVTHYSKPELFVVNYDDVSDK